jgi:Uma2 family endonuclease
MSTITTPRPLPAVTPGSRPPIATSPGDQRIVIRDVGWHVYETLVDGVGEKQHVYVAYDGKDLEIMTKGYCHEDYRSLFGRFVNAVTFELDIPSLDGGETTWKRPKIERGLEADQCCFFASEKLAVVAAALARKSNNINDYPNPDLAIEIDISPSEIDRPAIYAALQVAEVWRFDGEAVVIEKLKPDGSYVPIESSQFLPIRAEEILRWIAVEDSVNRTAWERRLRAWIRAELPGRRAGARKRSRRKT